MITKISKNTIDKLIIKDKNDIHDTLDSVDMASVEYVAFDIKNVGIFGYIMPADNKSGSLNVALEGENYVITQIAIPKNGKIKATNDNPKVFLLRAYLKRKTV